MYNGITLIKTLIYRHPHLNTIFSEYESLKKSGPMYFIVPEMWTLDHVPE